MGLDKLFQWWVWRGLALLGLGIFAITAPLVAAEWALALLGLYLTTAGLLNLLQAWLVGDRPSGWLTSVEGLIMTLAGVLVFFRPLLLLSGLLVLVAVALLVDGAMKLVSALRTEQGRARGWIALGGGVNVGLAMIVWTLRGSFSTVALGLVVGFYLLSQAWSTLLAPPEGLEAESMAEETNTHPDAALGLTPHAELGRVRAEAVAAARAEVPIARYWMLTLVLVFMAIHIGRMDASLTWLGLLSPTVAVGGDLLVALVLGAGLVMPMRLCCRKLTRPIERAAWRYRLAADASRVSIADQLIHAWLDARLGFAVRLQLARGSLRAAAHMALTAGLPLTVVLVAMNPIWGFTWYFNQGCHRGQGRLRFRSRDHRRRANTVPGARGGTVATCVWHPNGWATRAVLRHTDR
jgi:uncharacterized membrane protein HdeD (DUF308 family)